VTDIMMPDMNGLELITHMRSELPPPLPIVVACSGFPDFEEEARRRGARIFQPKPIDPDELILLIESLLAEREPPAHLRAGAEARRQAASELAQAKVSATLARRPHFREVAGLGTRLVSRYFGCADVGFLVMEEGHMRVFASNGPWEVGARLEAIRSLLARRWVGSHRLPSPPTASSPTSRRASTPCAPSWRRSPTSPIGGASACSR
jgi:CheY-like chemotaxis protein